MKWLHRFIERVRRRDGLGDGLGCASMTRDEAHAMATAEAASRKLRWVEPTETVLRLVDGRRSWFVQSNQSGKGFRVEVMIDDETRTVVDVRTTSR